MSEIGIHIGVFFSVVAGWLIGVVVILFLLIVLVAIGTFAGLCIGFQKQGCIKAIANSKL